MKVSFALLYTVATAGLALTAPAPVSDRERDLTNSVTTSALNLLKTTLSKVKPIRYSPTHNSVNPLYAFDWKKFGPCLPTQILRNIGYPFSKGNAESWKTFKANGVNLGGWMELEAGQQPDLFALAPSAPDEWTLCQTLGSQCGPTLERHYAQWYTKADIDTLAAYGINTLRVPTTYQAWINVPGSQLYHGNQQIHLADLLDYAASKYNMKVIIGLHSLPGGINGLDIGEAFGHHNWFYNSTNFDFSILAVQNVLSWINKRPQKVAFSLSPLNEAGDDLSKFGSPATLSTDAAQWVATYFKTVYQNIQKIAPATTMVVQDSFMGVAYWDALFSSSDNIIIDTHIYYFAAAGIYANYVSPAICGQGASLKQSQFPVFVGEWSLQSQFNNTLALRKTLLQTQQYAWSKWGAGGAFWSARFNGTKPVDGEGTQKDYWTYLDLIQQGVVNKGGLLDSVYCSN